MQGRAWSSFLSCLAPTVRHDDDSEAGGPVMTGLAAPSLPAPAPAGPEQALKGPPARLVARREETLSPSVTPYASTGSVVGHSDDEGVTAADGVTADDDATAGNGAEQPAAGVEGLVMVAGRAARQGKAADAAVAAGLSASECKPARRLSYVARALVTAPRSLHDPVRASYFSRQLSRHSCVTCGDLPLIVCHTFFRLQVLLCL